MGLFDFGTPQVVPDPAELIETVGDTGESLVRTGGEEARDVLGTVNDFFSDRYEDLTALVKAPFEGARDVVGEAGSGSSSVARSVAFAVVASAAVALALIILVFYRR